MKKKIKDILSLLSAIIIIVCTFISVLSFFFGEGKGNMMVSGTNCFKFYTVDSNIFAALSVIPTLIISLLSLFGKQVEQKGWITLFRLSGTVSVMLTFLTVVVFLGPTMGYSLMFEGNNLYMHLTTPIIALVSFLFFEKGEQTTIKDTLIAIIPTIIYSAVYATMVVGVNKWIDFYGFNRGGKWPIAAVIMLLAVFAICTVISAIRNKLVKNLG